MAIRLDGERDFDSRQPDRRVEVAFTREFEPASKLLRSLFPPNYD